MSSLNTDDATADHDLEQYGYRPQFRRSLRFFESFAVAFSFISITTGIFSAFGFALNTGGPRSIWTWWIVIVGQMMVAAVYAALAAKIPLSGFSYQWASRLAHPLVGWWFGWMSFAFLTVVTVAVDYGFVAAAFQPLIGMTSTPLNTALLTVVVLALQAALIIASTFATTRVNNAAVATELLGIIGLTVVLIVVATVRHYGHWSNLGSSGVVAGHGYYRFLGPFMLATLLGAYTIVGFESAANLAEETEEPRAVVPKAMLRAVFLSGIVGFAFLLALSYSIRDIPAATGAAAPVAFIIQVVLGTVVEKIFLVFVCVSIFACGLVIMVTNGRLVWSMARDRRLPGHQLWHRVPRATGGPTYATLLAAALGAVIVLGLTKNNHALVDLFTASSIMPALLYAGTVLLYVFTGRRIPTAPGFFRLGRYEAPVVAGALVWLAYELVVLIGPREFRNAQYYVLGSLVLGAVVFVIQMVTEPSAMRREPPSLSEQPDPAPTG